MTSYIAILEKEPDTLWGVYFPDLPGCTAAGESSDDAIRDAQEALRDYVESADEGSVPEPQTLEAIIHDPEVAQSLAKGAVVCRIPLLISGGRTVRVNLSMSYDTVRAIDEAANARKVSRSAFLESAARELILKQA